MLELPARLTVKNALIAGGVGVAARTAHKFGALKKIGSSLSNILSGGYDKTLSLGKKTLSTIAHLPITIHNAIVGRTAKVINGTVKLGSKGISLINQGADSLISAIRVPVQDTLQGSREGMKHGSDQGYNLVQNAPIIKHIPIVKQTTGAIAALFGGVGGAFLGGVGITEGKGAIGGVARGYNHVTKDIHNKHQSRRTKIDSIANEKSALYTDQYKNDKIGPLFYSTNTIGGTSRMASTSLGLDDIHMPNIFKKSKSKNTNPPEESPSQQAA